MIFQEIPRPESTTAETTTEQTSTEQPSDNTTTTATTEQPTTTEEDQATTEQAAADTVAEAEATTGKFSGTALYSDGVTPLAGIPAEIQVLDEGGIEVDKKNADVNAGYSFEVQAGAKTVNVIIEGLTHGTLLNLTINVGDNLTGQNVVTDRDLF